MNDIFTEKIVRKGHSILDYILCVGIVVSAFVVIFLLALVLLAYIQSLFVFVIAGIIYGAYWLIKNMMFMEYEYSLTNMDFDLDLIIGRSKRKKIVSRNIKDFELIAPYSDNHSKEYNSSLIQTKIYACSSMSSPDLYFCIFEKKSGGKAMFVFEPNEIMLDTFKKYMGKRFTDQ